ncbi:response regulator [Geomonas limicola]|nr:response regulator [Geomonas limicola]
MLIVEDDIDALDALRAALARRYPELNLVVATSGEQGLELFRQLRPQIVMSDIQMPGMSGIDMVRELRLLAPETRVVIITAHLESRLLLDCLNLNVSRYLVKPVENALLFQAVDDSLERIELEHQLKAQNAALWQSREQLRLALDAAALGTWDYRPGTGKVIWDERSQVMFGLEGVQTDYRNVLSRIHPEDRNRVDLAVQRASGESIHGDYHQEFRVVWPDGSIHWISSQGKVFRDAAGETRFIGANLDISARVQATEQLQLSESRYRGLFSSLQEGFSLLEGVIGPDGIDYRFLEVNPAFERLTGLRREQLIGKQLSLVFPDLEERWLACLATVAITGQPARLEHRSQTSDRYYEVQVYSPEKGQVAALYLDLSERRKLQMEREKNERLESLGVLAGGIAHDFNNILMAITGNISLARLQLDKDSQVDARLEDSEKAVAKATALTRQLLTFARGGEPVRKSVCTQALICEAASLFLSGGNCKAELNLPEDLWQLNADPGQIHQALNNLILNGVQAMPGGGTLTLSAANQVIDTGYGRGLVPGRYLKIVISDQGCGISPELLTKIFDPYFTTKPKGSGLGLASVFSIVKRHEGAISVWSTPGSGTSFELLLPAANQGETALAEPVVETAPAPEQSFAQGQAILVMDDEEMIRNLASQMLTRLGYRTTTCSDGAQAVDLYRQNLEKDPFAAVILDMTVPGGMGGQGSGLPDPLPGQRRGAHHFQRLHR